MKKFFWYSLNIYPTTREGVFKVVLIRRWGFHWHCKDHPVPKCKKCTDWGDSQLCAVWSTDPCETQDMYEMLQKLGECIIREPDNNNPHRAFLARLRKAR